MSLPDGGLQYIAELDTTNALDFRSTKGGDDDSDDEEGGSRPKKQRKPKERKRIEKVCSCLSSCPHECF